jgi:hypothetical protein
VSMRSPALGFATLVNVAKLLETVPETENTMVELPPSQGDGCATRGSESGHRCGKGAIRLRPGRVTSWAIGCSS